MTTISQQVSSTTRSQSSTVPATTAPVDAPAAAAQPPKPPFNVWTYLRTQYNYQNPHKLALNEKSLICTVQDKEKTLHKVKIFTLQERTQPTLGPDRGEFLVWKVFSRSRPPQLALIEERFYFNGQGTVEADQASSGSTHVAELYPFLDGEDLFDFVKKLEKDNQTLPLDSALDLAIQIADIILLLHAERIAHCDIKLENFIIRKNEKTNRLEVVGYDFESARRMGGNHSPRGTSNYWAPERFFPSGRTSPVDKLDSFAYGLSIFILCAKKLPFNPRIYAKTPIARIQLSSHIQNGLPDNLKSLTPIIAGLLVDSPKNRLAVSEALKQLLKLSQETTSIPNPSPSTSEATSSSSPSASPSSGVTVTGPDRLPDIDDAEEPAADPSPTDQPQEAV